MEVESGTAPIVPCRAAVVKSQGNDGRLRDASGIACPADEARQERARTPQAARRVSAKDGANNDRPRTAGLAPRAMDGCLPEYPRPPSTLGGAAIRDDRKKAAQKTSRPARGGPARNLRLSQRSSVAYFAPHSGQSILQQKFFFLHAVQFVFVHRQYAEFRIAHLAVELLVVLIKAAKLGVRLHHGVYVIFLLLFEHGAASSCVGNA
jgi:hypothetical protein